MDHYRLKYKKLNHFVFFSFFLGKTMKFDKLGHKLESTWIWTQFSNIIFEKVKSCWPSINNKLYKKKNFFFNFF